jgi:hypothetical protein
MAYKENPKTKGSGIICAIPQTGPCPHKCEDCFFQSGRSYLEPLAENLPNLPEDFDGRVVRVNDGNDSGVDIETVLAATERYPMKFFNTALPGAVSRLPGPVVLTVNPGGMTDVSWHKVAPIPKNLMFVRFRTNTWNLDLCDAVVQYYSAREVPIVLTFMAYYTGRVVDDGYVSRKRTLNEYQAITTAAWRNVMRRYQNVKWVHSCGKIEGETGDTKCRFCGNCLREYFATKERMRAAQTEDQK